MARVGVALIFLQFFSPAWARRMLSKSTVELPAFARFVKLHGRSYSMNSSEWKERSSLYEKRVAVAAAHNKNHARLWTAGVNELWDWTDSELSRLYGWKRDASRSHGSGSSGMYHASSHRANFLGKKQAPVPSNKSWTHLKSTSPDSIMTQGGCGSCWAIAATTTLQAHAQIHTNSQRTFSPQQIVSCVPNPQHCGGSGGCDGATVELAMEWVLQHGCAQEHEVPYHESNGQCNVDMTGTPALLNSSKNVGGRSFGMTGWEKLPENRYQPLLRALIDLGPVAVSVAADQWIYYDGGIFDGCGKDAIVNHAVVMTGFGQDAGSGTPYWVIQNSWGKFWGEHGSMRVFRHENENAYCGIDNQPQLGTGCIGGPPEVTVCGMCGILYDSVVPYFS